MHVQRWYYTSLVPTLVWGGDVWSEYTMHYWCLLFLDGLCFGRSNMGDPHALSIATIGTTTYGPYATTYMITFFDACWPNSCSAVIGIMLRRRPYPHIKATDNREWKEIIQLINIPFNCIHNKELHNQWDIQQVSWAQLFGEQKAQQKRYSITFWQCKPSSSTKLSYSYSLHFAANAYGQTSPEPSLLLCICSLRTWSHLPL